MARRYVYYRVAEHAVADVVSALAAERGAFELLRRPGAEQGLVTLMEVYPAGGEGVEARVAALVRPWLQGVRHVEEFEPLDG